MSAPQIEVYLIPHGSYREVACCLCGKEWAEQLVGVALLYRARAVGDLCPRCLDRTPAESVAILFRALASTDAPTDGLPPADLGRRVEELLARSAAVQAVSRRVRQFSASQREESAQARGEVRRTIEELAANRRLRTAPPDEDGLGWLIDLTAQLAGLDGWPTTVNDVIRAERSAFLQRVALSESDLDRVVDARYREALGVAL
ncbi:MAG: hypothetical protein U0736_00295 [Gemmataceae bacterium]